MQKLPSASLIVLIGCALAVAEEPAALPKDVPPVIGMAEAIAPDPGFSNWSLKLVVPKVAWMLIGERKPKRDWPELKVTVEQASLHLRMHYHPATQLAANAQNRVLDLKGQRLSSAEALKRLRRKTPVLVSVSGKMPDLFYLQSTKPDTLIVVLGIPNVPAPELLPRPAAAKVSGGSGPEALGAPRVQKERRAEGVLRYFPSNVRSRRAWLGHNFMVGSTPVLPTKAVPADVLKKHVGKTVVVQGSWHPGTKWNPNAEEMKSQSPTDAKPRETVRGDGLRAESIRVVEKE